MKTQAVDRKNANSNTHALSVRLAIIAAFSFFLPQTQILGGIAPFAVALSAALPINYAVLASLSSLLGYFVAGIEQDTVLYLSILALVMVIKVLFRLKDFSKTMIFSSLTCLGSFLIVNIFGSLILELTSADTILRICESVIACGICCFFFTAFGALITRSSLSHYTQTELSATGILAMLGVISLCPINLYQFNLGVMFGVICLHIAIHRLGTVGGSIGGILLSIALCLYSLDYLPLCATIVVSSFLAGIFQKVGKIVQVSVFLSSAVFCTFLTGVSMDSLFYIMCFVIASGLFLSIPERMMSWFAISSINGSSEESDDSVKSSVTNRLSFAAETIQDLRSSLQQVSSRLDRADQMNIADVYNKTATNVCQTCGLKLTCWDEHYNDTTDAFHKMVSHIRDHHVLMPDDVKRIPQLNCCRAKALSETLQHNYHEFRTRSLANRHITEIRGVAVEQLTGLSQMLAEVSEEIGAIQASDGNAAAVVSNIFTELADKPQGVFCNINKHERMEIEIDTTSGVSIDTDVLRDELSTALKRDFAPASIYKISNRMRISFYEKPTFLIDMGVCQLTSENNDISGDSYEYFLDSKGNAYLILSDGMGSGRNAALDSTMTCGIILKLIKAGFGLDSTIKFVNSSLQVKSSDESLSTIDIVKIDLYTGEAEFYKAGCACSFICLEDALAKVETNSLPVGILQGVEFDKKSFLLHEGDKVIMMTDGVLEMGEHHTASVIQKNTELSCEALSKKLCGTAANAIDFHDDLTVVTLKLTPGV